MDNDTVIKLCIRGSEDYGDEAYKYYFATIEHAQQLLANGDAFWVDYKLYKVSTLKPIVIYSLAELNGDSNIP